MSRVYSTPAGSGTVLIASSPDRSPAEAGREEEGLVLRCHGLLLSTAACASFCEASGSLLTFWRRRAECEVLMLNDSGPAEHSQAVLLSPIVRRLLLQRRVAMG